MNRRQEGLLLFLGSPDENSWRAERAAGVVEWREREVEAVGFLLEDDRMIDVEAAAAVLLRSHGEQPALRAELAAQLAPLLVVRVRLPGEGGVRVIPGGTLASNHART